eukprot:m51a1_g12743 hypothetical protein (104) ;mRNA; f:2588-2991
MLDCITALEAAVKQSQEVQWAQSEMIVQEHNAKVVVLLWVSALEDELHRSEALQYNLSPAEVQLSQANMFVIIATVHEPLGNAVQGQCRAQLHAEARGAIHAR